MNVREHAEALARDGLDRAKRRLAGEQVPYDSYTHCIAVAEDATDEEAWATVVDYFEWMLRGLGCTDDDLDGPTDYSTQGPAMAAMERMADEDRTVMALMRRATLDSTHGVAYADFDVVARFRCPNDCTWTATWRPSTRVQCPRCREEWPTDEIGVDIQSVVGVPVEVKSAKVSRDCIELELEVPYPVTRIPFKLLEDDIKQLHNPVPIRQEDLDDIRGWEPGALGLPKGMLHGDINYATAQAAFANSALKPFRETPWTGERLVLRFVGPQIMHRVRLAGARWRRVRFYFARPNMLGADVYLSEPLPKP